MVRVLLGGRRRFAAGLAAMLVLASLIASANAVAAGDTGKAWGYNGSGQLGDGNAPTGSPVPVSISGLSGATQLSEGTGDHALALLADGTVVGWGSNYGGQLGDGSTTDAHTPVAVSGITNAVAVAAGGAHSLALLSDGTVVAWGRNYAGQLGRDNTGLDDCGGGDPCSKTPRAVPGLTGVVAIAAGGGFSLALVSDGTIMAWGRNSSGQLGDGDETGPETCNFGTCSTSPQPVPNLTDVVDIAAGDSHSLALLADGTVMGWGSNGYGETGMGSRTGTGCSCEPTPVAASDVVSNVVDIAAGSGHSVALLSGGGVMAWGDDEFGEVGNGSIAGGPCTCVTSPATLTISGVTAIASGAYHVLALRSNGTVKAWGNGTSGTLGNNDTHDSGSPVDVSGLTGATALGAGYSSSYALVGDSRTLTISLPGTGDGKVVGKGISCPPVCSHAYPEGAKVILRTLPATGTSFAGFGGACAGSDPCLLTLDQDRSVSAQFGSLPPASTPPAQTSPAPPATGQRSAALRKCININSKRKRKKCAKHAMGLPL